MLKKEIELEEKVHLLEKEMKLLGDDDEKLRLDLTGLKLEIECIKMILKDLVPDFEEKYTCARDTVAAG